MNEVRTYNRVLQNKMRSDTVSAADYVQIMLLIMEGYMGKKNKTKIDIIWKDRKRTLFLGLPWSFTRYSVSKERLFISRGFLNVHDDEVRLYRVMDISLTRSFMQRLAGIGTINICSGDKTMGDFELKNIKNPKETKELISDLVEKQRDVKRVVNRENMIDPHMHQDGDFEEFHYGNGPENFEDFGHDDAPFDRD